MWRRRKPIVVPPPPPPDDDPWGDKIVEETDEYVVLEVTTPRGELVRWRIAKGWFRDEPQPVAPAPGVP